MFEIYEKKYDGSERNVSEEIGYYADENAARLVANTFGSGAEMREVDGVFVASQQYLSRVRGA